MIHTSAYGVIYVHSLDVVVPVIRKLYPWKRVVFHYHGSDIGAGVRRRGGTGLRRMSWPCPLRIILEGTPPMQRTYLTPWTPISSERPLQGEPGIAIYVYDPGQPIHIRFEMAVATAALGLELHVHDKRIRPVKHVDMPSLLCRFEYFIDRRVALSLSRTALGALACGVKVVRWDSKVVVGLPGTPARKRSKACGKTVHVRYGVVIPARNEEGRIGKTLKSLRAQTIPPARIVVVDDSSTDGTASEASRYAEVVRLRRSSGFNAVGTPYLAAVINAGLSRLVDMDAVMVAGADCVFPPRYVEELYRRMRGDGSVIGSGTAEGERTREVRDAGMLIDGKWFRTVGFRFPTIYGFYTWLILRAVADGRKVSVYSDVKFYVSRGTARGPWKAYVYGKAMKTLGYPAPYALARAITRGITSLSPQYTANMLRGYAKGDAPLFEPKIVIKRVLQTMMGL